MIKRTLFLFFSLLLLGLTSACQKTSPGMPPNTVVEQLVTGLPDQTPVAQPTPTSTRVPCTATTGTIQTVEIPSDLLTNPISATVYLPPCYGADPGVKYPTLYMLHGQAAPADQWIEIGLTETADQLISEKKILPMIIVMPFEESWHSGPEGSNFGSALIEDVIPYIEGRYSTQSNRQGRAIGGLSRGGNWAVYLGFSHPEEFAAVGAHSTPLFYGEIDRIENAVKQVKSPAELPAFYVDMGKKDEQKDKVLGFVDFLKELGVGYEFHQNEGRHENSYWSAHTADYLLWYSAHLIQGEAAIE